MGLSNESPQVTPSPGCPVDHSSDSWKNMAFPAGHPPVASHSSAPSLSQERVVSSIPRKDGSNWVYPSQAQFYSAMTRKNHNPQAVDMRVVVPIHNAVNERAWGEVMRWEKDQGGEKCGGVKLVSFKGRPQDRTIRAWCNVLLGYQAPFDRHDWIVQRCGVEKRYIIDFYTGRNSTPSSDSSSPSNIAFYLDVRPAIDNWDGLRLRTLRFWESIMGRFA